MNKITQETALKAFKFNAEISYQPINKMYSCQIKKGNNLYFEVDENMTICIHKCIKNYMKK